MLRRLLRFFGAPRAWRVVALLVLGALLSAAAYAFQLPPRSMLSRGFHPAELVGVYEIAAPRPGVYIQLSADGSARVEFLNLEDTGKGLRAMAGERRKAGWWWVEQPEASNPVTALFARPRLCEQFKPAHPPQCYEFGRDSVRGDLTIGEFSPFGQRVTTRYNKRTVRQAVGELRNVPSPDSSAASPTGPPGESGAGSDSSEASTGASR